MQERPSVKKRSPDQRDAQRELVELGKFDTNTFLSDDKAKSLYDTAQLEEKQFNKPRATKLYR
jgi:hypothetical protein